MNNVDTKNKTIYDFKAKDIMEKEVPLSKFTGKVLLIVNTASKCGFTNQYKDLQELYEKYKDKGLEILAFPCNQFKNQEPGDGKEIKNFCEKIYHTTFPLFAKIDVKGENIHPLYDYLTNEIPGFIIKDIKWNFTKFLVDKTGKPVKRYAPNFRPKYLAGEIEKLLQ